MIKRKTYKTERKAHLKDITAEVNATLSRNNARASLVIAYVFTVSMAGLGLICSYLLLNLLDYCSVEVSAPIEFLVMFLFVFLFTPPAFASVRNSASALCDGREVAPSEIFAVFTSFKGFLLSYLPIRYFAWFPKYTKGNGKKFWSNLICASNVRMRYSDATKSIVEIFLSVVTCFIYFILIAGPRAAIRRELVTRRIINIYLKNNERTVKRND